MPDVKRIYTRENAMKWQTGDSINDIVSRPGLVRYVKNLADAGETSLIDIGSGTGRWTKQFAENLERVVGVDISPEMLRIARETNPADNVRYLEGSMFDLRKAVGDESFDIATAFFVLNYAQNKRQLSLACKEAYEVLYPGGTFLFLVPHPLGVLMNRSGSSASEIPEGASPFESFEYRSTINLTDGRKRVTGNRFYSIEDYMNSLAEAGFFVSEVNCPRPTKRDVKRFPWMANDRIYPITLEVRAEKR